MDRGNYYSSSENPSLKMQLLKKWETPSDWTFPNSMPVLCILQFHDVGLLFAGWEAQRPLCLLWASGCYCNTINIAHVHSALHSNSRK